MHKDLFKNRKLNHYHFIVERIVQQNFESHIYIHKKCIHVLRLLDNVQKDHNILRINMDSIDLTLPYMCYFNLLGTMLDRFKASSFVKKSTNSVNTLSQLLGEYLIITSQHSKKVDLFVQVRKSFIQSIIRNFIKTNWKNIHTCQVIEVEKFVVLDSNIFGDVNGKIDIILTELFGLIINSANNVKDVLKRN
eukprot:GAHX01002784.1.p1 GENE.GAHX01002784.1~~GAHX01002784.1.p1  ORF type:complete len:200 (-),score=24.61 GAHX01002784.1:75-650(-)